MSAPTIKPISPEELKLWEAHNIQTLREWRAIPFSRKIQMLEEMEEVVRAVAAATSLRRPTNTKSAPR
ncbi:MAG: hypothetical protein DMF47_04735, partial [Verrucomicrobia bacterium]